MRTDGQPRRRIQDGQVKSVVGLTGVIDAPFCTRHSGGHYRTTSAGSLHVSFRPAEEAAVTNMFGIKCAPQSHTHRDLAPHNSNPQGTCSTEQYGLKTRAGCCGTECFWICEPPKTAAVQGANSKNRQQSCCPQRTATCRCCRRACGGHCVPQPPRSQPRQLCLRRSQRHRPSRPRPRLDADLDQRYV